MENINSHLVSSIHFLQQRLDSCFQDEVNEHFLFGSSVRGTILPRRVDEDSDIDYMVVFKNEGDYKPATLLNWLRSFVETTYSRSEIYQSHPTIVLELDHIKFELVPAVQSSLWMDSFYIPAPTTGYMKWMPTEPSRLNDLIENANRNYHYQIKRLIRILKYWNVRNDRVYSSYELETFIGNMTFLGCNMMEDYFYYAVRNLPTYSLPQYKCDKVVSFKEKVEGIRDDYYNKGLKSYALMNLKLLLPLPK